MRAIAMLPAVAVTLGALVLTAVFAVIPALSTTDYLEIERGSDAGDLAILGGVEAGSLSAGDVVAARFVERPGQPYVVVGVQEGSVLLAAESDRILILAPEAMVVRRVTGTVGGLGAFYGFVDSAAGWGTIVAGTVGVWLLTLVGLRTMGRRPERVFASAERALPVPAGPAVAGQPAKAEPVATPKQVAIPEPAAVPEAAPRPTPMPERSPREPLVFPAVGAGRPAAEAAPAIDDLVLELARQVARQAPQAGLRHARRVTELSTRKQTLGWAGLAATAAAVAAATYLVASERTQGKGSGGARWGRRWL